MGTLTLKELSFICYTFRGNLPLFHGVFNNSVSTTSQCRRHLDKLSSLFDLDLFNLCTNLDGQLNNNNYDHSQWSLLIARVKFEPESSSSPSQVRARVKFEPESSSSQGPFQFFCYYYYFLFLCFLFVVFILISLIVILAFTMMCRLLFNTFYTKSDIFPVSAIARVHSQQRPKTSKIFPSPLKYFFW